MRHEGIMEMALASKKNSLMFIIKYRDKNALKNFVYRNVDDFFDYYQLAIDTAHEIDKKNGNHDATQFVLLTLQYEEDEEEEDMNKKLKEREDEEEKKLNNLSQVASAFSTERPDILQILKENKKPKILSKLIGSRKKRSTKRKSAKREKREKKKSIRKRRSTKRKSIRKRRSVKK